MFHSKNEMSLAHARSPSSLKDILMRSQMISEYGQLYTHSPNPCLKIFKLSDPIRTYVVVPIREFYNNK